MGQTASRASTGAGKGTGVGLRLSAAADSRGRLIVRVGVRAPRAAYPALTDARDRPLARVGRALVQRLAQKGGVEALLGARPEGVAAFVCSATSSASTRAAPAGGEAVLRETLQRWILRTAEELLGLEDEAAIAQLVRLARVFLQIVAASAAPGLDGEQVQALTATWLQQLVQRCLPPGSPPPQLNLDRLARVVERGPPPVEDPMEGLQRLGVELPADVPEERRVALFAALAQAEREEEEETFTMRRIVQGGRVSPGMAAGFRRRRGGGLPHVFLYDLEAIRRWQQEHGTDPLTREEMGPADILPLTPA